MYPDTYCGGLPFEWDAPYQGVFLATQNPNNGDAGWKFENLNLVRSVRVTAEGTMQDRGDMIGVKLVVWPLYNMDAQLGFLDEFTCQTGTDEYHDVGLTVSSTPDFKTTWPSACASPIDRVYCIERTLGNWGAVDDWPSYGFDFADNWDIPKAFEGTFPMGSIFVDRYYSSWTVAAPCRDYTTQDTFAALPTGACVVTKMYTEPCTTVATSLDQWVTSQPQLVLNNMGGCTNADGTQCQVGALSQGGVWPLPLRCAWTRVVDDGSCGGPTPVPTAPAPTAPAPTFPPTPYVCQDIDERCGYWATQGDCTNSEYTLYMHYACSQTCGFCH